MLDESRVSCAEERPALPADVDVSVILPVHNAGKWLGECLQSILDQHHDLRVELSVFLDSCTDESELILQSQVARFHEEGYLITISEERNDRPKGVGYAKNKAVGQSRGEYLCFMDADDKMMPDRIRVQYEMAFKDKDAIIGSRFIREPPGSTVRYCRWANTLSPLQLHTQVYTSNGPTVIMPTWFCHRHVYQRVGGFDESGRGTPEDLIFFYKHLTLGGRIARADQDLLLYRYHKEAATFSVLEETIWRLRVDELEKKVLQDWTNFAIWNAGKQGRKLYRSLKKETRHNVTSFCDVDAKKIGRVYTFEETEERPKPEVPIVHFADAKPPFIICVKMDLTGGDFEKNLSSLHLTEGRDYFHFN